MRQLVAINADTKKKFKIALYLEQITLIEEASRNTCFISVELSGDKSSVYHINKSFNDMCNLVSMDKFHFVMEN